MRKLAIAIPIILLALIVVIPQAVDGQSDYEIPSWIKKLASFWVNDEISDKEFGTSISYLIDKEVIQVPMMESLKQENTVLKNENAQLKASLAEQNDEEFKTELTPEAKVPIQKLITVSSDKSVYQMGEAIIISGEVDEMLSSQEVLVTIKDSNQNEIYSEIIILDENQKFSLEISEPAQHMDREDRYSITAQYQEISRTVTIYIDVIS
jgi:hypothetical protein